MRVHGFSRWARKVEPSPRRWIPFVIAAVVLTAALALAVTW